MDKDEYRELVLQELNNQNKYLKDISIALNNLLFCIVSIIIILIVFLFILCTIHLDITIINGNIKVIIEALHQIFKFI